MSVSKKGIQFSKLTKDSGFFFRANYVINGLSEETRRLNYHDELIYDNPKKLGKQIEYLGLSDYLWNHKDNAKVYLYVECVVGRKGYRRGFNACSFYVEAAWMDLETKKYHKQTSNMTQGEYENLMKMLNVTYLEN